MNGYGFKAFLYSGIGFAIMYSMSGITFVTVSVLLFCLGAIILGLSKRVEAKSAFQSIVFYNIAGIGALFLNSILLSAFGLALFAIICISFIVLAFGNFLYILKYFFWIGCFFGVISMLASAQDFDEFSNNENDIDLTELLEEDSETTNFSEETTDETNLTETSSNNTNSTIAKGKLISHKRKWQDYNWNDLSINLEVWSDDYKQSVNYRNRINIEYWGSNIEYWAQVYEKLIANDSEHLDRIVATFDAFQKKNNINKVHFAEIIISCIQNIPYVLVHENSCEDFVNMSRAYADLHSSHKCKSEIKFGLQSPTEFMADLKGDCDTRSVLLFTILSRLGYKVAVLNSDEYGHSILGINLPSQGEYFVKHRGVKYYVWETTAEGWKSGTIPPDMTNMNYWQVAIAN